MALGPGGGDAEQVSDRAPAGTDQGGAPQEHEPLECWACERGCDGREDRRGFGRYTHRGSSLVVAQEAGSTPDATAEATPQKLHQSN
jgi:hypothetical protein